MYFYTKKQLNDFQAKLNKLNLFLYKKKSVEGILEQVFTQEDIGFLSNFAKNNSLDLKDRKSIIKLLDLLNKEFGSYKIITIEASFSPTLSTVKNIVSELGEDLLVDLKINPKIIAGAIIYSDGKVGNYSINADLKTKN